MLLFKRNPRVLHSSAIEKLLLKKNIYVVTNICLEFTQLVQVDVYASMIITGLHLNWSVHNIFFLMLY